MDGEWADWADWGACSASCGGGERWRHRRVVVEASACGRPALGPSGELRECGMRSCAASEDCRFGAWSPWSLCSSPCEGRRHRRRIIEEYGQGAGRFCEGAMREVASCGDPCEAYDRSPPLDCVLEPWQEWLACSASCGPGQTVRRRLIWREARHAGRPCLGRLEEAAGCGGGPCPPGVALPKPCRWGSWSTWSACDQCSGERRRARSIEHVQENGGVPCSFDASEEVGNCPRHCSAKPSYFCSWGPWEELNGCSRSCGEGYRREVRYLHAGRRAPLPEDAAAWAAKTWIPEGWIPPPPEPEDANATNSTDAGATTTTTTTTGGRGGSAASDIASDGLVRDFGIGDVGGSRAEGGEEAAEEEERRARAFALRLQGAAAGVLAGAAGVAGLWAIAFRRPDGRRSRSAGEPSTGATEGEEVGEATELRPLLGARERAGGQRTAALHPG